MSTFGVVNPQLTYVETDCNEVESTSTPSDAILKPRGLFSQGWESKGQQYRFGELDQQGFVNIGGVETYVGLYGEVDSFANHCARGIFDWQSFGGRDNGGYITSRKNTRLNLDGFFEGSYICYGIPTEIPSGGDLTFDTRSLGMVCAFNLFGVAPAQKISVMGLGTIDESSSDGNVPSFLSSMHLWIDTDLTIGCSIGTPTDPFFRYDVTLGVLADVNNWFALELQGHNQVSGNNLSGFALAQLYTGLGPVEGIACIRSIGIQTHAGVFSAFAVGSDVAKQNGGIDNLGIDDLYLYDSLGTVKKFAGNVLVGPANPIAAGDSTTSIISFDSTHIIHDSANTPATVGFPTLHGDSNRWKNVNGLLNLEDPTLKLTGADDGSSDITYGGFSATTGLWSEGPYNPGVLGSVDGDPGTGPFIVATMENNIIRNTYHDENIELYQLGHTRTGIALVEGIQMTRRTGVRHLVGGVFQHGVFGAATDLFSALDDFACVIPSDLDGYDNNDANDTVRRVAHMLLKDSNGTWSSPPFVAGSGNPIIVLNTGEVLFFGARTDRSPNWVSIAGFQYQPARSFLDHHPITGVPFTSLDPSVLQAFQGGFQGDLSFYDNTPANGGNTLSHSPDHRWIRFDACEIGFDFVYHKAIPEFIEHPPFPPIACLNLNSFNRTTRTVQINDISDDWDGTIVTAIIDWGDGTPTQSITVDGGLLSHTYSTPGIYTITETVTDNDGLIGVFRISNIPAYTAAAPGFTDTNPSGNTIDFTDVSTANDETITAWHYDFGDGNTSSSQNPNHTYTAPGTYSVIQQITGSISGVITAAPVSLVVPIPVSSQCNPSAAFMANTADVVGDDFNGDNPPLPNYANVTQFDDYYEGNTTVRFAYWNSYATINDGIEHNIDTVNKFNSHNTYDMVFGKPGATTYQGAGWTSRFSDDANPTETALNVTKAWIRARFKADAGIVSETLADTDLFEGLEIFTISPTGMFASIMVRNGSLFYDDNDNIRHRIGAETLVVGVGYTDVLMLYDGTNHSAVRQAIWIAPSCTLAGKTPVLDITNSVATSADATFEASQVFDVISYFNCAFNPTGALKHLHVADWEMYPFSVAGNPFSVNGI